MFLFKGVSKSGPAMSEQDQAALQRRLYLAENTPEPVFDLSECQLTEVPAGVAAKCRVFRKTSLLLQKNLLTALPDLRGLVLLTVLDASCNQLKKLPESIGCLVNLVTLDVHSNQLTKLPASVAKLRALRTLDVSENRLSYLPQGVRQLGCTIRADGCPLLEQIGLPKDAGDSPETPAAPAAEDADDPDLASVWDRRERMLRQLREQMTDVEERLYELTVNEYEKRDRRQNDNMVSIAEERVQLAASLNDLITRRELQLSEFRAAGVYSQPYQFEDSGVVDRDCVVCLESGLQLVVFLPCGHVCACRACTEQVTHCPLCRQPLTRES
ncbi:RING finger protein B-like [Tropilaelaps mercedesae]|uniref:RING finger protein B-like n=1 Tax=Tropilaelaps mercedesae TaxID=418985 RepID=A0A1V9X8P2_9ACAR|nr:RING finger protein B-like [Tropilaelaps mercedesae]